MQPGRSRLLDLIGSDRGSKTSDGAIGPAQSSRSGDRPSLH
jgi:hypothetical protein